MGGGVGVGMGGGGGTGETLRGGGGDAHHKEGRRGSRGRWGDVRTTVRSSFVPDGGVVVGEKSGSDLPFDPGVSKASSVSAASSCDNFMTQPLHGGGASIPTLVMTDVSYSNGKVDRLNEKRKKRDDNRMDEGLGESFDVNSELSDSNSRTGTLIELQPMHSCSAKPAKTLSDSAAYMQKTGSSKVLHSKTESSSNISKAPERNAKHKLDASSQLSRRSRLSPNYNTKKHQRGSSATLQRTDYVVDEDGTNSDSNRGKAVDERDEEADSESSESGVDPLSFLTDLQDKRVTFM